MRKLKKSGKANTLKHTSYTKDDKGSLVDVADLSIFPFESIKDETMELPKDVLEDQREILSRLYNLAPVSYFILDILGVVEEVNKTGRELFGYSKLEMQNKRFQNFILHQDLQRFNRFMQNIREDGSKKNIEIKLILPNKKIIYAHIEGIMVRE